MSRSNPKADPPVQILLCKLGLWIAGVGLLITTIAMAVMQAGPPSIERGAGGFHVFGEFVMFVGLTTFLLSRAAGQFVANVAQRAEQRRAARRLLQTGGSGIIDDEQPESGLRDGAQQLCQQSFIVLVVGAIASATIHLLRLALGLVGLGMMILSSIEGTALAVFLVGVTGWLVGKIVLALAPKTMPNVTLRPSGQPESPAANLPADETSSAANNPFA